MAETDRRDDDRLSSVRARLLEAALPNVAFDGWSEATLRRAASITGDEMSLARLAFPRGGIDMALAFHRETDRKLAEALDRADLDSMRIRERITFAVRKRIELLSREREAVRRGASLMALPLNAPEGARALWETADLIWNHAGDMSTDYNWYTKRAILASVISSTMLYWLGDESTDFAATWSFLDRRIENVMQFEKQKAAFTKNPVARATSWGPRQLLRFLKAPKTHHPEGEPGRRAYAEEWDGVSPVSVGDPLPD